MLTKIKLGKHLNLEKEIVCFFPGGKAEIAKDWKFEIDAEFLDGRLHREISAFGKIFLQVLGQFRNRYLLRLIDEIQIFGKPLKVEAMRESRASVE